MRRSLIALVAFGLVVAACGNDDAGETTTTVEETTTTPESTTSEAETTTTTVDDGPRSLLTGLPVDDPSLLERRAVAVKVDNHPDSRPQAGVQDAEIVFEILVEGVTRWLTVFHTTDSEFLGGNRSGRPSDARLIRPLEAPFLISGAQPWIQSGIRDEGVSFFIEPGGVAFRVPIKRAPHNLFVDTVAFREYLDETDFPDDPPPTGFWEFGELPEGGTPVETVDVSFSSQALAEASWEWDGTEFLRVSPSSVLIDEEGEETPISADVLITIVGHQYIASSPTGAGSSVPSTETTGEGRVIVMADGEAVEGTWEREESDDPFTFTTEEGEPLLVPPGRPWVNILPDSEGASIEW